LAAALPLSVASPAEKHSSIKSSARRHNTFHPLYFSTVFAIIILIIVGIATKSSNQHQLNSSAIASSVKRSASTELKSSSQYVDVLDPTQQAIVYDVIVVGCGPAGLTASLYASRIGLSVLVIGSPSSGSLSGTDSLDNFPSFSVDRGGGQEWLDATMKQTISFGAKFVDPTWLATDLTSSKNNDNNEQHLHVVTVSNSNHDRQTTLQAKSIIIATGSSPRKLNLPLEAELWGRHLHNCALCDGDLYASRSTGYGNSSHQNSVAVIGGGDAALEAVSLLSRLGANIHWIHRRNNFRARQNAVDKVRKLTNVKIWQPFVVTEWVVEEIEGQKVLVGVRIVGSNADGIADPEATSSLTIPCDGAFLMLGSTPNTRWLKDSGIELDSTGLIKLSSSIDDDKMHHEVSTLSSSTSLNGVFSAGEVSDAIYKQALTASSDGAKAAMDVERYLRSSSFEVTGVQEVENVVSQDYSDTSPLEDNTMPSYIDCDMTRAECIKSLVAKHTVVVFSKPFCPYCRRALEALRSVMKESPFVVDLTEMGELGWEIQQTLGNMTGRRTVPNVFIHGESIGGGDETVALYREGKLSRLVAG
jgi:thioredoxin reductase (NADPH)